MEAWNGGRGPSTDVMYELELRVNDACRTDENQSTCCRATIHGAARQTNPKNCQSGAARLCYVGAVWRPAKHACPEPVFPPKLKTWPSLRKSCIEKGTRVAVTAPGHDWPRIVVSSGSRCACANRRVDPDPLTTPPHHAPQTADLHHSLRLPRPAISFRACRSQQSYVKFAA